MSRTYSFATKTIATEEEIQREIKRAAQNLAKDYKNLVSEKSPLVLICVLKGSYLFTADLARALADLKVPNIVEFICVSSYGGSTKSSGEVRMLLDLRNSISGKHIIFVEDIVDSGRTLHFLMKIYGTRAPASMKSITLLDKPMTREVNFQPNYSCFKIPNEFVIGYGLDYMERYRDLRDIVVLKPEVYSSETADRHKIPSKL
jgi:hypoxanthine phosphoribosyltransferase